MPVTETMLPGAIAAASPPPDRVVPLAVAVICAAVAAPAAVTVTYTVIALPAVPAALEVRITSPVAESGVA